jgi:2-isopropylmalate synthase
MISGPGKSLHKWQIAFLFGTKFANRKVSVFDTTLRDGEQTPGVSFTIDQKIEIARRLSDIGVSMIEAGFPASSDAEFDNVSRIVRADTGAPVCGLARSVKGDVDRCVDAGVDMVHVFIPTSEIQRIHTIKKTHPEVVKITDDIVRYAASKCDRVMFSAMDATRTGIEDLIEVYSTASGAGAEIVNVPDTVGIFTPTAMKDMVSAVREHVDCRIDVHCHNDFGLAVANTISAVEAGADQVQVTVNGIGERAGNADISQTVMIMEAIYGINTGIVTEKLVEISRLVSRFSGIAVPPVQPVVGDNAFSHESGIHSHGVLSNPGTFEPGIMTPEMVGHRRRFKLGKHAGSHAVRQTLVDAGINPDDKELEEIVRRMKEISGRGKKVTDNDLFQIADMVMDSDVSEKAIEIDDISIFTGIHAIPTASVRAIVYGKEKVCSSTGDGPVDAAMNALMGIIPKPVELKSYQVEAISGGTDAIGCVTIAVEDSRGRVFDSSATNSDIVLASVEAMVNALNLVYRANRDQA